MRHNCSIRKRGKRRRREVLDIDITSLLDILVILLVFLLKSYNSSGVIISVPRGVNIPSSASESLNTSGVVIQVSKNKIWFDEEEVVDLQKARKSSYYRKTVFNRSSQGRMIIPLFNALIKKKKTIKQVEKSAENASKFTGVVNLVIDKDIGYYDVRKVMYTVASAGYSTYKFVVLGEEEN